MKENKVQQISHKLINIVDLLYFILFHWYFLALKKSALRKCPYINNEFGQPIFWHVSQIWIDVLHQLSFIAPTSLIYVAWSQFREWVWSQDWPSPGVDWCWGAYRISS